MSICKELAVFANEDALTNNFLIPLLRRLGFSIVVNYHGKREFGKDLVVGEIDRFNHVRYHGLQAKHVPSIGKESVHGLIQDCDEAFAKDFTHPQTGQEQKISSFYAVNSGSISDEARDLFFATLRPRHGDTVRLLSGSDILSLDRSAGISRVENIRDLLVGLLMEISYNTRVLEGSNPGLNSIAQGDGNNVQYPPLRMRVNAVAECLLTPSMLNSFEPQIAERYWAMALWYNRILDSVGTSPLHTVVSIKIPAAMALQLVGQMTVDARALTHAINLTLGTLGPFAAI